MLKIAIVTKVLAPYQAPVFSEIARTPGVRLFILSCGGRDAQQSRSSGAAPASTGVLGAHRSFVSHAAGADHGDGKVAAAIDSAVSQKNYVTFEHEHIAKNAEVFSSLHRIAPDVIATDGFSLAQLNAFFHAVTNGVPHVSIAVGADGAEKNRNPLQAVLRRFVYARSSAFVATSQVGQDLFDSHGLRAEQCFRSCPCVDNAAYLPSGDPAAKRYDLIFSGQIEASENPLFALDVGIQLAKRLGRKVRILYVGEGSQTQAVRKSAMLYPGLISVELAGAGSPSALPALYGSAQLLLFPATWDPWGVIANEACAAGLPVIVSPYAGVADELVRNGQNGFVCELDVDLWADKAEYLLTNGDVYQRFSDNSRHFVSLYTFSNAAAGLLAACRHAVSIGPDYKAKPPAIKRKPRVLIVERQLLHYRLAFYNRLRDLLEQDGIELQLLIGHGTPDEKMKKDEVSLDWAHHIPTRYIFGSDLCWQPFGAYARDADLVIVMHENKIIYNLWLMFFARPKRLAFWGHGANMQSAQPNGWKERFKRWTINKVDWWFAYTESSAKLVTNAGFPNERTTVVENSIDTEQMSEFCRQVGAAESNKRRLELGLEDGPIGLYLGSLYKEKRLDFLLSAAQRIREKIPGFQLLVVGAGPEQKTIENAARENDWIHYLGPLTGREKATVLVLADVILNPGLVGLGILDSFISGTPMYTTNCGLHSPEISYMSPGQNGVMTEDDLDAYSGAVIEALSMPETIARLSKGALSSASRYSVDNMANRIRTGIRSCLNLRQA
ncbi:hypothetical protein BH11PSE11_BH11PSE11_38490 [soil metagenome]